jgi:Phospholipase_D-nuclease N-terminal
MKLILEILVAIILHPIAWILMLLNLLGRTDLSDGKKVIWALVGILWGIGPILYVLVGDGALW